jgi:hypothetical protein
LLEFSPTTSVCTNGLILSLGRVVLQPWFLVK